MTEEADEALNLSDVFNDDLNTEESTETEVDESEKGETVETESESKQEDAEDEVKTEAESEEEKPVESPSTETVGLKAALVAERQKRQEAEEKLKEALGSKEPEPIPDVIEDPEGYARHIQNQTDNTALQSKISISRSVLSTVKEDYSEKEQVFMDMVGEMDNGKLVRITDQTLFDRFKASDNPALFAYEAASEKMEIDRLRDPKYIENLKKEWEAEILAKYDKTVKAVEVPSLTEATAEGANSIPVEKPLTLQEVFKQPVG